MEITPEIRQMVAMVRQQRPETSGLPDEILISMVMDAMQGQTKNLPYKNDLEKMLVIELDLFQK